MCLIFETKHVNLAVYLTAPGKLNPPRVTSEELRHFLVTFRDRSRFRSWDDTRFEQLTNIAENASTTLPGMDCILEGASLEEVLGELRKFLFDYKLFVMPIGYNPAEPKNPVSIKFEGFLAHAAASSGEHALVLIPHAGGVSFAVLDPLPQVLLLADHLDKLPGVLFWSKTGAAAVASLEEAYNLYEELRKEFVHGGQAVNARLSGYRPPKKSKCRLHLSDTHFGSERARANKEVLLGHLRTHVPTCTRVVITGDLIDNPTNQDDPAFAEFKEFRRWLTRESGADVIVVPGNHDQRWHGNKLAWFGNRREMLADLHWDQVVSDHALRSVFLCFDSSRGGLAAAGEIKDAQMEDVMREFETQCSLDPRLTGYLRIALLHHHPFPYVPGKEKIIQRALAEIRLSEESFLQLTDRDRFAKWCARHEVPVVLHGHKHIEHHHLEEVSYSDATDGTITKQIHAIGCGTSLGAEGCPGSYNLLTLDPDSHRVTVLLCSDDAKGGEIRKESLAVL
jgi:3',5'-cyclic AMP phosphodiesterase CpdA